MNLEIRNCNNIDAGTISLVENKLNIKYAMNGAGKSTVARAIELQAKNDGSIAELTPFKFLNSKLDHQKPSLSGLENVASVMIFNDAYINQFAFKQDEILVNSFDIFVKTPDFESNIAKIENVIRRVKDTFRDSKAIDQVISDLGQLIDSFGKSKSGYSEAGAIAKGFGKGNKVANIPKGLESFCAYLQSSSNSKWLRWHMEGNSYTALPDNCPYCTSGTIEKKDVISRVSKEYDPKSIEHLNKILTVVESLGKYFSNDAKEKLDRITCNSKGLSKEEISYLLRIKEQAEVLLKKMMDLKGMTYFSLKDVEKVSDFVSRLKIDLSLLPELYSDSTSALVSEINSSLDHVLSQIGTLQGEVALQNELVRNTIEQNKSEINTFLRFAGYKYYVDVEFEGELYKMRLRHIDSKESVANGSQHLSYGEKNAFSLVLFMYQCLATNPDVIILDDPISSFDRNKKYAVIDMLFRGSRNLRGRTVLLMTHDLEPVIDITYTFPSKYAEFSNVMFIESKEGNLKEIPIQRSDLQTFYRICEDNMNDANEHVIKLVYLRRLFQILNDKGNPYQLLSSLLHKRNPPTRLENGIHTTLSSADVSESTNEIKKYIPTFSYDDVLANISDEDYMKNAFNSSKCNYEKLHLFRIQQGRSTGNDVVDKFINETFHIENEYIMQINPRKYEIVPTFIIDECGKILSTGAQV